MDTLYDRDFYSWALEQAQALRLAAKARLNTPASLDWQNLAEEIESLGKSQASELESRYYQLLTHMLKWQFQPERRSGSWRGTIVEQRYQLGKLLKENPGLKPSRARRFHSAYAGARHLAAAETDLPIETFPVDCPWSLSQACDMDFLPD